MLGRDSIFGESVVEEDFDGGFLGIVIVRDEADKATFGGVSLG